MGLKQFRGYQINSHFRIDEAITASAKAALLATRLQLNITGNLELFTPDVKKENCLIEIADFIFLNKLQAEPLFYWSQALKNLSFNPAVCKLFAKSSRSHHRAFRSVHGGWLEKL